MCLHDMVIMKRLEILITICGFICELTETHGQQCGNYSKKNVHCSEFTLINGYVCYDWYWETGNSGSSWSWSTFRCLPGYTFGISRSRLYCKTECKSTEFVICDYEWDGSPPVCQPIDTTDISSLSSSSTTTSTTTSTATHINTKTSLTATTAITTQTSPQVTTPVTFLNNRPLTVGSTNLSSAQDKRDLFLVYVAVPVVFVVGVVLAVLLIACKRHNKKRNGLISSCRGKSATKELSNRTEINEPCYRNLQLNAIVDECQEVDKAYTSLRIEREHGVYETMGNGAIPMNTNKQPETIAGGQTIDDKAYTSLCILKENDAYSILGTVP